MDPTAARLTIINRRYLLQPLYPVLSGLGSTTLTLIITQVTIFPFILVSKPRHNLLFSASGCLAVRRLTASWYHRFDRFSTLDHSAAESVMHLSITYSLINSRANIATECQLTWTECFRYSLVRQMTTYWSVCCFLQTNHFDRTRRDHSDWLPLNTNDATTTSVRSVVNF